MPNKQNEDRRHHIPKKFLKVTNWLEYSAGLCRCGNLTSTLLLQNQFVWSLVGRHPWPNSDRPQQPMQQYDLVTVQNISHASGQD